jgi:glutaredoxin
MSNLIIIFTLQGCSHCVELKKKLKHHLINFNEIEVGDNQQIWDKVVEQTGHNALPTVYVALNGGDDGPVFVPERDYQSQEELIEKLKKYV